MPGSSESMQESLCVSPKNDNIQLILKNERIRYLQKGLWFYASILITVSFFYIFRVFFKSIWADFFTPQNMKFATWFGSTGCPNICFLIAHSMMFTIYFLKHPFFEQYKIVNRPWPWDEDKQKWKQTLKETLKYVLINHFFVSPGAAGLEAYFGNPKFRRDLESFPSILEIMWQIVFFMLVEDFFFYWAHRLLHIPVIYKVIHKKHHEYNHTICLTSVYSHPIEFLFGNLIPMASGYIILGDKTHFATVLIWYAIRVFETVDGHGGYEFPWSPFRLLPFSNSSESHNFHHSHNVGNYGSFFSWWDTLCGTNKDFFEFKAKKDRECEELNKEKSTKEQKQK